MVSCVDIAGRTVGPGRPCFVIAEAGVNHDGDLERASRLVEVAAVSGADAVKFQTFSAERLALRGAPKAPYQVQDALLKESQFEMLRRLELTEDAHRRLMELAQQRGIVFLSSPFDEASADLLDALGVAAFKIPSGELTNLEFLNHVARKGKPLLISTGMATLEEVMAAVRTVRDGGNERLVLLHCVSAYPADPADANLRVMTTLEKSFGVPVGFSDHTRGVAVALAAVALGACVLEKHVTLDRTLPGPDHRASLEPGELLELVRQIRVVESALGDGCKRPSGSEEAIAAVARKSLVAARTIRSGSVLTEELIAVKRPGTGLPPSMRAQVLGRQALRDIPEGTVLTLEMFR